ncbi:hypothetical protein BJ546DRAFT_842485 [Cryomyces antarcticus]|nr:hypothetical protein LTR04_005966 [Oleoguttula sp. CCFEE 6159]
MARVKSAPSHYPRVPFHILRAAQLLSSLVVGAIMLYFIWHLTHDHWKTPWTFLLLTAVSLLTVLALTATIILHCCCGLNPRLNIFLNSGLAVLWAVGFSLLSWWMSGTLTHVCNTANWHDETGIMVCRIYKSLFTFSLLGLISTLLALALDLYVRARQTQRGIYKLQDIDVKPATRGPFTDDDHEAIPRESGAFDVPYTAQPKMPGATGYAVPEGQFAYGYGHDTRYHGGQVGRGGF